MCARFMLRVITVDARFMLRVIAVRASFIMESNYCVHVSY